MVTSSQGIELQKKVWQEILDVLQPHIQNGE
jgi:hypothetical protein